MLTIGSIGFFLITLDILIVNLALPRLSAELGGTSIGRQWVIDAYTLTFASLLLFGGNLADRAGAKRGLALGTGLFVVASAVCAITPTLGVLIGARVFQGAAAAVLLPASMSLIREAYPDPRARARALGSGLSAARSPARSAHRSAASSRPSIGASSSRSTSRRAR